MWGSGFERLLFTPCLFVQFVSCLAFVQAGEENPTLHKNEIKYKEKLDTDTISDRALILFL